MKKIRYLTFLTLLSLVAFIVTVEAQCNFSLGNDTAICAGDSIKLSAPNGAGNIYLWDNGSTLSTRYVSTSGTYFCSTIGTGANSVVNGDFSSGNNDFTSDYVLGTPGAGVWGSLSNPGSYLVTNNAHNAHSNYPSFKDHSGMGNMIVVNGSITPNQSVWCQSIAVTSNTNYNFSLWVATCIAASINDLAILQISINGIVVGAPFSPSQTAGAWTQFNLQWNSGTSTNASICIADQNTNSSGNDFALDDILLDTTCTYTDTIHVSVKILPSLVNAGYDTTICTGASTILNGNLGNGTSFSWTSIPAGFASSLLNPTVSPLDTTVYILISTLNGCSNKDTVEITVDPCAGIRPIFNADWVRIFPNPFTSEILIEFKVIQKSSLIRIIDASGNEIRKIDFYGNQLILEREGMPKGLYFVQVIDPQHNILSRKIIAQ